jgi:hypothetical protein
MKTCKGIGTNGRIPLSSIRYRASRYIRKTIYTESLTVLGLDTEAWQTGQCFMITTSLGDVFSYNQYPAFLFSRKYRGRSFVCYNLAYDEGALLQVLPREGLQALRAGQPSEWQGYTFRSIPKKCLTIHRGSHSVHIYDMYNFYQGSLAYNAETYLSAAKLELETKRFGVDFVTDNWSRIGEYSVRDSTLVASLAEMIIKRFESYGIYPRKLFSTAYISYQYFSTHTPYVTVRKYWQHCKPLLQASIDSYNGGKFEVTTKGAGFFYEYDIISAYPAEIRNLIDISWARVEESPKYQKNAIYAFLHVQGKLPVGIHSPVAYKYRSVNVYPVGYFDKWVTLAEYDWLLTQGADLSIQEGWWLKCDNRQYPYRKEIDRLTALKTVAKKEGRALDYHTLKILLNSLYGKMVQLIPKNEHYEASTCWNPIYGAIITANVRIRVSEMQQAHASIWAVHTDSVISTSPLPTPKAAGLGDFEPTVSGPGVILGSGIYQIGSKVRFRGFNCSRDLLSMLDIPRATLPLTDVRAHSWKEVCFHNWELCLINRFESLPRTLRVDFDRKRIWLQDWKTFAETLLRPVESLPYYRDPWGF